MTEITCRQFNYESDVEHIASILEKGPSAEGVISVEKLSDTLARITYDPAKTNMGVIIRTCKGYRVKAAAEEVKSEPTVS